MAAWRPALVGLKSRLVMVKSLAEIGDVMPAPFMRLQPEMRIGLIPFGWSDGYPKNTPMNATTLVRAQRAPLIGPTHSELIRVDLTNIPDARIGDEVVLLGRSGPCEIRLEDLAEQWGMAIHDLYPIIGKTLPRRYLV